MGVCSPWIWNNNPKFVLSMTLKGFYLKKSWKLYQLQAILLHAFLS